MVNTDSFRCLEILWLCITWWSFQESCAILYLDIINISQWRRQFSDAPACSILGFSLPLCRFLRVILIFCATGNIACYCVNVTFAVLYSRPALCNVLTRISWYALYYTLFTYSRPSPNCYWQVSECAHCPGAVEHWPPHNYFPTWHVQFFLGGGLIHEHCADPGPHIWRFLPSQFDFRIK